MMFNSKSLAVVLTLLLAAPLVVDGSDATGATQRGLKKDGFMGMKKRGKKGGKKGKKSKGDKKSSSGGKMSKKLSKKSASDGDNGMPPAGGSKPLDKAIEAIGGADALMALGQFSVEASGSVYQRFENETPEDLIAVATYDQIYSFDLVSDRLRVDTVIVPLFELFEVLGRQTFTRVVNGNIGGISPPFWFYIEPTIPSENVAALKRQATLFNPHVLFQQALMYPDLVVGSDDDESIIYLSNPVWEIMLKIGDDGFVSSLTTMEVNPLARDTEIVLEFSDWTLGDSLLFPQMVTMSAGGALLWEESRSMVDTVPDDFGGSLFMLPEGTDAGSYVATDAEFGMQSMHNQEPFFFLGFYYPVNNGFFTAEPVEVITDVAYMLSSVANSVVIRHADGLIVIEASGSDLQGQNLVEAVEGIAKDGETVTHLIQSHHHIDHAGSCRYFLGATGAPNFVVGHGVGAFWEEVLTAESMVRPDTVSSENPYEGKIWEVEELGSMILVKEENLSVTVHHTDMDPYAEDAVIVVIDLTSGFPGIRAIYQADMYNGGFGGSIVLGGPPAFFALLRELDLIDEDCKSDVTLFILSSHGVPQSLEESLAELKGLEVDVGCPV